MMRASATVAGRSPSSTSGDGTSSDSSAGARVVDAPESSASTRTCPSTRTGSPKEWERRDESFLGDVCILRELMGERERHKKYESECESECGRKYKSEYESQCKSECDTECNTGRKRA